MAVKKHRSVIVACTLRSGSNLLCELLQRFGYGRPTEFFQTDRYRNVESIRSGHGDTLPDLTEFHAMFADLHTGQRWRGAKWNLEQFTIFRNAISDHPHLGSLQRWLPDARWIRLSRKDLLAQAVSMYIAKQTGIWVAGDTPVLRDEVKYDFDGIWREFADFSVEEMLWDQHFKKTETPFVAVSYEELVGNYPAEMRRILDFVDPGTDHSIVETERLPDLLLNQPLGNPLAATFVQRFRADLEAGAYRDTGLKQLAVTLMNAVHNTHQSTVFEKFIGEHAGLYPMLRKLDLLAEARIVGPHEWVEQPHFLDRVAVRLDANAVLEIEQDADRLFVEFLGHPWSGHCEITINDRTEVIDLYSGVSVVRPWLAVLPNAGRVLLRIRPLSRKSDLSDGTETWVQRIWIMQSRYRGSPATLPPA